MPPAVAAVVSIAASVGIAALKVAVLVKVILTIAVSLAITLLAKKPKANRINQGQELRTKYDPNYPREVLVGRVATGGSVHYSYTTTDNSKKPNRYLYRVIQISDRPIYQLNSIREGSDWLSFSGDVTTGWRTCDQHRTKAGAACMWVRVYLGSDTPTADATLISETSGEWTAAHKGKGIAYAIVKYDYDADAFPNGEPELVFVVEGAKLYDDRFDSTVPGGTGVQRLNDYSTWEYSANAAIITSQFLRGFFTAGVLIVGVQADARDMDSAMLLSAYNTCSQSVEIAPGGVFEDRYQAGLVIKASDAAADTLLDLQTAMDGKIFDRGGYITILPGADRTPVMEVTDDDIDWTAEKSWQPKANLEQMLNHITANFVDAEQNFQERELPVLSNATWEADDGGERFSQFFSLRAVNRWTQGQRITKRLHEASRYSGTVAFVGGIWLIEMEQGDWFTLTSPRWGMTSKYFEIQEITLTDDARVVIIGREVDPDSDIWDYSVDEVPRTDSTWTPPAYGLPTPLISGYAITVTDPISGQESYSIWAGLDDSPALYGSFVKFLELQYTYDDMSVIGSMGIIPISEGGMTLPGLAPETSYYIRGRLSDGNRYGDWTAWEEVVTPIGAIYGDNQVSLFATRPVVRIPVDDSGVPITYLSANTYITILDTSGSDISSDFSISVSVGGNPAGLTVSIVGDYVSVSAGFVASEDPAILILDVVGSGAYSGMVFQVPWTLQVDYTGIMLSQLQNANDYNDEPITAAPTSLTNVTLQSTAPDGRVTYTARLNFTYNSAPDSADNFDDIFWSFVERDTNAAVTIGGPENPATGERGGRINVDVTKGYIDFTLLSQVTPNKWYTLGFAKFRKVDKSVNPKGYFLSPFIQYGPFQPTSVQNVTANIGGTAASTVATGANKANTAIDGSGNLNASVGVSATQGYAPTLSGPSLILPLRRNADDPALPLLETVDQKIQLIRKKGTTDVSSSTTWTIDSSWNCSASVDSAGLVTVTGSSLGNASGHPGNAYVRVKGVYENVEKFYLIGFENQFGTISRIPNTIYYETPPKGFPNFSTTGAYVAFGADLTMATDASGLLAAAAIMEYSAQNGNFRPLFQLKRKLASGGAYTDVDAESPPAVAFDTIYPRKLLCVLSSGLDGGLAASTEYIYKVAVQRDSAYSATAGDIYGRLMAGVSF